MWRVNQIKLHKEAANHLLEIKDLVFSLVKVGVSEYSLQQFILAEYRKRGLVTTFTPIVAFDAHAAVPHYFPKKRSAKLTKGTLILIDMWAKMKGSRSPYADITWVGYHGKPSQKVVAVFNVVVQARDAALRFIKNNLKKKVLPTGAAVNDVATDVIKKAGYGDYLKHRTGHCIGTTSPHGAWKNVSDSNKDSLQKELGYTIEPGVYIDGKFGVRSEIDFYISKKYELIVTTTKQQKIVLV